MDKLDKYFLSIAEQISPAQNRKRSFFLSENYISQILLDLKYVNDFSKFQQLILKTPPNGRAFLSEWTKKKFEQIQCIKHEIVDYCIGKIGLDSKDEKMVVLLKESIYSSNLNAVREELKKQFDEKKSEEALMKLKSIFSGVQIKIMEFFKKYDQYGLSEGDIKKIGEFVLDNNFQEYRNLLTRFVGDIEEYEKQVKEFLKQLSASQITSQFPSSSINSNERTPVSPIENQPPVSTKISYCVFIVKCKKGKSKTFIENGISIGPGPKATTKNLNTTVKFHNDYVFVCFQTIMEENYTIQLLANPKSTPLVKNVSGKNLSQNTFNFIFDFCLQDVSTYDFQKVNRLKAIIYLITLTIQKTISNFSADLISTFENNVQMKTQIITKIDENQEEDVIQLFVNFPNKLFYLYCVLGAAYSQQIYRFGKPSVKLQYFEDRVVSLCNQKILFCTFPFQQLNYNCLLMKQMCLKVSYCYGKNVEKTNTNFNYLISNYGELTIDFLIRILYNDYTIITNQNRKKVFQHVNKELGKLIINSKRGQLQKLYLLLVYNIYIVHGTADQYNIHRYIVQISTIIDEINENDQSLPKPKHEQFYKNIISEVFRKIMKSYVKFDNYSEFIETIHILFKLPENIYSLIKSHECEEVVAEFVRGYIKENKTKESIYLINLIFLTNKNRELVNSAKREDYIKEIFSKEIKGVSYYSRPEKVWCSLQRSQLECYVSNVAYIIFRTAQSQFEKNQVAQNFYNSINGYYDLEDVFRCINKGLKHIDFTEEIVLKNYLEKYFFPSTMNRCVQLKIWRTFEFITSNRWRDILSLEPILKNFMIEFAIEKSKLEKTKDGQHFIDVLANSLVENVDIEQEKIDEFFFRIVDGDNENLITYEKLKEFVFKNILIVNSHYRILKRGKDNIKLKLKNCILQVGEDMKKAKINFSQLNYLKDLDEASAKILSNFFTEAGVNYTAMITSLVNKNNQFLADLNKVKKICKNYSEIAVIQKTSQIVDKLMKLYQDSVHLNFEYPLQFKSLVDVNQCTVELLHLPLFKNYMSLNPLLSLQNFCLNITEAKNKTALEIIKIIADFRNNSLTLTSLMQIIKDLNKDEIKNLFSLQDDITEDQITQIIQIKQLQTNFSKFSQITSTLLLLAETFKNSEQHITLSQYSQELKKYDKIKSKDFCSIANQLMELMKKYSMSKDEVENIVRRCNECQETLKEIVKI